MNEPVYQLPLESRDVGAGALRVIREVLPMLAVTTALLALVALVCVLRGIREDLARVEERVAEIVSREPGNEVRP